MKRKMVSKLFVFLIAIGLVFIVWSGSLGELAGNRFVYFSPNHAADAAKVTMVSENAALNAQIIGGILMLISGMGILCLASGHWQEPE